MLRLRPAKWLCIQTLALAALTISCKRPAETTGFTTAAKLPFGAVDTKLIGQPLHGTVQIVGWALSEGGMRQVLLYLDRNFVTLGNLGMERPDVAKNLPGLPNSAKCGWEALLDTSNIAPGSHRLTIQAQSKDGATYDLLDTLVTIEKP